MKKNTQGRAMVCEMTLCKSAANSGSVNSFKTCTASSEDIERFRSAIDRPEVFFVIIIDKKSDLLHYTTINTVGFIL